jgi:membrane-bound lytic murein transglycosylase D
MGLRKELIGGILVCLAVAPLWQGSPARAEADGGSGPQRVDVYVGGAQNLSSSQAGRVDLASPASKIASSAADSMRSQAGPFVLSPPKEVPPFPIQLNQYVLRYLADFAHAPDSLQDSFDRSRPFLGEMVRVLRSYGVPDDMVYLAFAESAFVGGQTKGIWQFNAATARRFGLHVDSWVDERRDPVMSTRAAAEYLATLHDAAGSDWRVALVGWNNGDNAIDRYWSLRGSNFEHLINRLPRRTRALLGRFMAVAYIAHHAASYGMTLINYDATPAFRQIRVRGGVALRVLAVEYGTTVDRLRAMNPALKRDFVPPWAGAYDVRLPLVNSVSNGNFHSLY